MKKFYPLIIITILASLIILTLMPGCDELVTKENYYYDTIRIFDTTYVADTTCGICHNDNTDSITIASRQWQFSGHAAGNLINYEYLGENTNECGPECHTSEGYVQYLADSTTGTIYFPTEIGCFGCHSPHQNRDFSLNDSTDMCIHCHQQTIDPPSPGLTNVFISKNWGPHFSTESGMLLGTGGYEFASYGTYANSQHAAKASCQMCHMDSSNVFTLGGHSLNISYNSQQLTKACNIAGCHEVDNVDNIYSHNILQDTLAYKLTELEDSLISIGLLNGITYIPDTLTLIKGSYTSDWAGVLFNYLFVSGDSSSGVHNLLYARDLVNSSLDFINDRYSLTVSNPSTDSGTVAIDPATGPYIKGTIVEVTATPNAGYNFVTWIGDTTSTDNPIIIIIEADKTITVNFEAQ